MYERHRRKTYVEGGAEHHSLAEPEKTDDDALKIHVRQFDENHFDQMQQCQDVAEIGW